MPINGSSNKHNRNNRTEIHQCSSTIEMNETEIASLTICDQQLRVNGRQLYQKLKRKTVLTSIDLPSPFTRWAYYREVLVSVTMAWNFLDRLVLGLILIHGLTYFYLINEMANAFASYPIELFILIREFLYLKPKHNAAVQEKKTSTNSDNFLHDWPVSITTK